MRQRRWIELLSDYDCEIRYHPGKANVVADTLSRKGREKPLRARDLMMTVHNDLSKQICEAQEEAMKGKNVKAENLGRLIKPIFEFRPDGTRCFRNRVWLPRYGGLRDLVMHESTLSPKRAIMKLSVFAAQPEIPVWMWERITMDFMSRLPRTPNGSLQKALGTNLDMSTAYRPQTDGQSERTIQTLEDMLRACIKNRLLTARSRQKSYVDRRLKPLEFKVGDMVLLKVSPWKGAGFIVLFMFRILKNDVLAEGDVVVPMEEIQLDDKLHMIEEPVEIVDKEVKRLKQSSDNF
ncbi:putative reverse transcriptase domain-containing protein [Tanacetum coccineum]